MTGAAPHPRIGHGRAALVTLAVVAVVAAYLAITGLLGITEYWAGFLFLSQWGLMHQLRLDQLAPSALGAATGTALSLLPFHLPALFGTPGLAVALAASVLTIYATVKGWLPLFINAGTMFFLTVVTVPEIAAHATPAGLFAGLAAGVVCFGGLRLAAEALIRARAGRPAAAELAPELPAEARPAR